MGEKETTREVVDLRRHITDMSKSMRLFSLSMRSLYVEKAVGTKTKGPEKFRKLRDDTRNDAMVYLKGILPLSTKFVSSIYEYFEYYEALGFEEWCEMLSGILEKAIGYRQLCETLLRMHEDILVPLKKRRDEAKLVFIYEERKGDAAIAVGDTLIPALERFIEGIIKAAAFFSIMEQEIRKFEGQAEKGTKSPKKLYYKIMNKEAKDMKSICQMFYAVLPVVSIDFEAIPTEGTDQNYVERWLEKQKKIIEEKCSIASLAQKMLASLRNPPLLPCSESFN